MAELTTIARPYAKAAFEYAVEAQALDQWANQLSVAAAVTEQDTVAKMLASPLLTADQKGNTLIELCGDTLNDQGQNYIRNLAANKRIGLLPAINVLFEQFKAQLEKSIDVEVTSAYELSDSTLNKLAQALHAKLGLEVNVEGSVDPDILGGVVIRAGDILIDDSIKARLAKLAEAMSA